MDPRRVPANTRSRRCLCDHPNWQHEGYRQLQSAGRSLDALKQYSRAILSTSKVDLIRPLFGSVMFTAWPWSLSYDKMLMPMPGQDGTEPNGADDAPLQKPLRVQTPTLPTSIVPTLVLALLPRTALTGLLQAACTRRALRRPSSRRSMYRHC